MSVTTVTVTVQAECEALFTYNILRASALDKQVNNDLSIASASQASPEKVNVEVEAYVPVNEYRIAKVAQPHQAGVVYVQSSLRYAVEDQPVVSVTQFTDLLVRSCVAVSVTISTHSTANTQALTLLNVVSEACPIFTAVNCGLSPVHNPIIAGIELAVNSSIFQFHDVCLPSILFVAMSCILAKVTALFAIVKAVAPVTSPVCVAFVTFAVLAVTAELFATSVSKSVICVANTLCGFQDVNCE